MESSPFFQGGENVNATMAALKGATVPDHAPADGLALHARDIGQKFGFDDGGVPDPLWEILGDYGLAGPFGVLNWWDTVLWTMVQAYLVPAIESQTDAVLPPLMLSESTSHNPIRFTAVDLDDVDLPKITVHVPWLTVLAHAVIAIEDAQAAKDAASPSR